MLLTITLTEPPATDLGFLLHKHPDRLQSFDVSAGQAHVFYPEAGEQRCTAALLLEIDPIGLVRGHRRSGTGGPEAFSLAEYVNDRPYAASSMLAVALGKVFRTAMTGRCDARPDLAARALPLEIGIPALSCRGGTDLARRLLRPLGWDVQATRIPLDPELPEWGGSHYVTVQLTGRIRLADALSHLYVLLPVLDDSKHYWVDDAEIDKLLRAGGDWLATHPERELITHRYLAHQRQLTETAVARLAEVDDTEPEVLDNAVPESPDPASTRRHRPGPRRAGAPWPSSAAKPCWPCSATPCSQAQRRPASPTSAAGRAGWSRCCWASRPPPGSSASTCRTGRWNGPPSGCTWTPCRTASASGWTCCSPRSPTPTRGWPAWTPRCSWRSSSTSTRRGSARWSRPCSARPGPAPSWSPRRTPSTTSASRTWPRARCGTRITGSSGPGPQFREWAAGVAGRRGYQVRFLPVGPDDPEVGPPTQLAVFTRA